MSDISMQKTICRFEQVAFILCPLPLLLLLFVLMFNLVTNQERRDVLTLHHSMGTELVLHHGRNNIKESGGWWRTGGGGNREEERDGALL
jgi:hypothetical protein